MRKLPHNIEQTGKMGEHKLVFDWVKPVKPVTAEEPIDWAYPVIVFLLTFAVGTGAMIMGWL